MSFILEFSIRSLYPNLCIDIHGLTCDCIKVYDKTDNFFNV